MAIKKSELYSSLWQSCDALRGSMDASQYKDYVLVLLFIKYVSDKYAGRPFAEITIPAGANFTDLVALKGKSDIGDQINKMIIGPLAKANQLTIETDFNDATKLGSGKEMVDRLTNLIAIFETKALNFASNRAEHDDILGDAYEYLMRHFATESGKSKGQFYTPAEVSRIIAQIIGIGGAKTSARTTVYDPTCGSGSLLLKVADAATTPVTLYGQEKDSATSGLARMNLILHNNAAAEIQQGNTLTDPKFKDGDALKTFDYVVANPPFSDKSWSTGLTPDQDPHDRFKPFGIPPNKQGDYAYLLHIVRSLKSTGTGACILPHGVLFRGNAEATIRTALIRRGYIAAIIGLPANLFYGTGIPACIMVIDKREAAADRPIFMIDASRGFAKDGPKNRLRAQDIHRIVDAFTRRAHVPRFSRLVPFGEIERNEFNLNLPRYIDSTRPEDLQDLEAHLRGGIPIADIEALKPYWRVCPGLLAALFKPNRPGYVDLAVEPAAIRATIVGHPEFAAFIAGMNDHFAIWRERSAGELKALEKGCHPTQVIAALSESLLAHYADKPLIDAYDIYQHLMDYWAETMQDDLYLIAADGWKAEPYRVAEKNKAGKEKDKGWICDLIPKPLIVARFFGVEQRNIDALALKLETVSIQRAELEEQEGGEEGALADFDPPTRAAVGTRLKQIKGDKEAKDEAAVLAAWMKLDLEEAEVKRETREVTAALDAKTLARYGTLTKAEIKTLVVEDKWMGFLHASIHGAAIRSGAEATKRVHTIAARYERSWQQTICDTTGLGQKISRHLDLVAEKLSIGQSRSAKTEVGWQQESLEGLAVFYKGKSLPKSALTPSGANPCIHYGELFTQYPEKIRSVLSRTDKALESSFTSRANDVLMPTSDVTPNGLAKASCIQIDGVILGGDILIIRCNPSEVFGPFLSYAIRLEEAQVLSLVSGTTVFHLYAADMKRFTLRLPQLAEQKAIVDILDELTNEIDALERQTSKARALKQGMMQQLLTGRTRLV